jgi:hypothetical protein
VGSNFVVRVKLSPGAFARLTAGAWLAPATAWAIAAVRRRRSARPQRANSGHSSRSWRTGQTDPLLPFLIGRGTEELRQERASEKAASSTPRHQKIVTKGVGLTHGDRWTSKRLFSGLRVSATRGFVAPNPWGRSRDRSTPCEGR